MFLYFLTMGVVFVHNLAEKFLENEEYLKLSEDYFNVPTEEKKQYLQAEFNKFCLHIKMLSYFSKSIHFFAQNFDKKNRERNKKSTLTLADSDDHKSLQNIPDEQTLSMEVSFDVEHVADYFENATLYEMISKLTAHQKKILYLFYVQSKSDKEISAILGVSIQTVNKQRNAILTKLKGGLKDGRDSFCTGFR